MSKIAFPIFISIFLSGCIGFPNGTISQPVGKVIVDEEQYTMMPGDYEWKEDSIEISTKSTPGINELAELFETLEVNKGDILKLEIDKNPSSISIAKLNEDGTSDILEMKDNEIIMPSESGYYIYEITTSWTNGKQIFVFDVNVD
ncbi:hypothetical protein U5N28_17880 [Lysinibacillus telephonicus]|uniref:Lipoprotein n=1 Tax=Lysinibacillus telephonicus TaxID=1714840 RepID=A0A431UTH0_9BACI|nr:hypothetical protein [Lysinibacillus telephonicus]RTQ92926.1 hypothetical protein EKG35_10295 [Lysinibacillus telephonicus]